MRSTKTGYTEINYLLTELNKTKTIVQTLVSGSNTIEHNLNGVLQFVELKFNDTRELIIARIYNETENSFEISVLSDIQNVRIHIICK